MPVEREGFFGIFRGKDAIKPPHGHCGRLDAADNLVERIFHQCHLGTFKLTISLRLTPYPYGVAGDHKKLAYFRIYIPE